MPGPGRVEVRVLCLVLPARVGSEQGEQGAGDRDQARPCREPWHLREPRIHAELQEQGVEVGRKRVARLMRENGVAAGGRRRYRKTTDSDHDHRVAPNVLDREFVVTAKNRVWAGDITYVWTSEGWLYLAVVLDLFSRRVVGWAVADHMRTDLVLRALDEALLRRRPGGDLLHHSDRGSQHASDDYRARLEALGIECSMSRKGNCWDNAVVESFFGTLKTELGDLAGCTRAEARAALFEYVEVFYNRERRHSYLGYVSPARCRPTPTRGRFPVHAGTPHSQGVH